MIRTLIFDFDGTLADTAQGIIETQHEVLRQLGLPPRSEEQIRAAIGLPLAECLRRGGDVPEERTAEAVILYRKLFFTIAPRHIRLFDGVPQTLAALAAAGIRMAVATSRGRDSLGQILQSMDLARYFEAYVTADDGIPSKPRPDMVLHLLGTLQAEAQTTLVVGDTTFDLDMGREAGCLTCGVSYGNHSREILQRAKPDWIIDDFPSLINLI